MGFFEVKLYFDLDELRRMSRVEAIHTVRSWIELWVSEVMLKLDEERESGELYSGN